VFRVLLSPKMVGLHLLALVATTAAVWLGVWQYDAWQTRREMAATDRAQEPPVPLEKVMSPDAPFPADAVGQPVDLEGEWVTGSTFFVAGRQHAGRSGFWVVTPVAVCATSCGPDTPAMPVVRGWAPRPDAVTAAPTGHVTVTGWLQPPEGTGRPDPDPTDDVLEELRIADAIQHVDQDLYGAYVITEDAEGTGAADATVGLEPVTPDSLPEPDTFTAVRNLLYAVEWWVFGAFALFVWWRWCSDELTRAGSTRTGPNPPPGPRPRR
jgi:surfeit locus 1 family protein